jgi:AcrR family transcriptional regulator
MSDRPRRINMRNEIGRFGVAINSRLLLWWVATMVRGQRKRRRNAGPAVSSQRERLLAGAVTAAGREGYPSATVSAIIAAAGVSRPTFYEHFENRSIALLAAADAAQRRLAGLVREELGAHPAEQALAAALSAIFEHAERESPTARFLAEELLGGGPAALELRDRGVTALAGLVQARLAQADTEADAPDLPAELVIAAAQRGLATRLRRSERSVGSLAGPFEWWLDCYARPLCEHRRSALGYHAQPPASVHVPVEPLQAGDDPRERIIFAVAELAERDGYGAVTVAEITRRAGLDGRAFYRLFADKHEAFAAVHELGFRRLMEATADAFFSGPHWPERNWRAGCAFTEFLARNPLVANVGFVEAHAAGLSAIQRLEESRSAFGMLMQDGNRELRAELRPGPVAIEAIVNTIFEVVYRHARDGATARLPGLVGFFSYLVLVPFDTLDGVEAVLAAELEATGMGAAAT